MSFGRCSWIVSSKNKKKLGVGQIHTEDEREDERENEGEVV